MKELFVLVSFSLILHLPLEAQTANNNYAVFITGMEALPDRGLKTAIATEIITSAHKEIVNSDSLGIRQVLSSEDMEDAIREFDPDGLTCPETDCLEQVVRELGIRRLILIKLHDVEFTGTEKDHLRISGTFEMSQVNVETLAGIEMPLLLSQNSVETRIRGDLKEFITFIRFNIWKLFSTEPLEGTFTPEEQTVFRETFSQKLARYLADQRFLLTIAGAAGLLIGGALLLTAASGDASHTYPPDFPEIP